MPLTSFHRVADINKDGRKEIVAAADDGHLVGSNAIYALYCQGDNPLTDSWQLETSCHGHLCCQRCQDRRPGQ
jgi:hypothetical protein